MLFFDNINNEFDVANYSPLSVSSLDETFSSVSVHVDITITVSPAPQWHHYPFHIEFTGTYNKYRQNNYPCVVFSSWEGWDYVTIDMQNAQWQEVSGSYVDFNGIETAITENTIVSYNLNNNVDATVHVTVTRCELPIALCYTNTDFPDKLKYYYAQYDYPSLDNTCLNYYHPVNTPITEGVLKTAINTKADESPEGEHFEIKIMWSVGEWVSNTQPQVNYVNYQWVRGEIVSGKLSFYKIDGVSDGKLKYGIKNTGSFYDLEYSTDGVTWHVTNEFPFAFLYRKRDNELGTFGYALSEDGVKDYFPVWDNEEDAQDYIDGDKLVEQAPNFNEISSHYPINNLTEDEDTSTTMGEVYTKAFFSQQYLVTPSGIQEISNALFDTDSGGITGIVDDIIKGLRMFGNDITQAVQSLMFYPVSLDTIFTNTQSQNYIYFGGYKFDMTNSVKKLLYPNGHIDFGSFDLRATFGDKNFRNYAPYSRLFCYLAYIGWVELDIARYIGSTVNIKYYIDTRTGLCMACLFKGSILVDYFQGQMGVQMPITLTDYSRYAQAQIQTLLGGANSLGNTGQQVSGMAFDLAKQGAVDMASIGVAGVGLGAVGVGIGATKTLYGLTQNNINNFNKTKGGSSSMLNQYLPQECMFMFEIQDVDETPNHRAMYGYPSNASGQLQNFSGYLEVDTVNLICSDATANEKAEIVRQLQSGVYI